MATFHIKAGDTSPVVDARLLDGRKKSIPLVDGDTVKFRMVPVETGIAPPLEGDAEIVDYDHADVRYEWADGDTDVAGTYRAEFYIAFGDGGDETVPSGGYIDVVIHPRAV